MRSEERAEGNDSSGAMAAGPRESLVYLARPMTTNFSCTDKLFNLVCGALEGTSYQEYTNSVPEGGQGFLVVVVGRRNGRHHQGLRVAAQATG